MSTPAGKPLAGRRVLVTRAAEQAAELIDLLETAGADVVHVPAIRFDPPSSWESIDLVIDAPDRWDWLIFTSVNGVSFFADRIRAKGRVLSEVLRAKIAAVGATTAEALRALGAEPDVVPASFRGMEILPLLPDNQEGVRTAVIRALEGRDDLLTELRAKGGDVYLAVVYETRGLDRLPDNVRDALAGGMIDALTFTSPSTVRHVLRHLSQDELARVKAHSAFVSIGPATTSAIKETGVEDVSEADEASVAGLVRTVVSVLA